MVIKYFSSGFVVKLMTGIDDSMVHIPIIGNLAKTKRGRVAFAFGIFIAISFAILISFLFSNLIRALPYYHIVSSVLILILAGSIYWEIFLFKPRKKVEEKLGTKKIKQEVKIKRISWKRFLKLVGLGFLTAFATVIDDTIAYSSLFLNGSLIKIFWVVLGILTATILQLYIVVRFSKHVQKIPYKKEVTVVGLIVLAGLIYLRVL